MAYTPGEYGFDNGMLPQDSGPRTAASYDDQMIARVSASAQFAYTKESIMKGKYMEEPLTGTNATQIDLVGGTEIIGRHATDNSVIDEQEMDMASRILKLETVLVGRSYIGELIKIQDRLDLQSKFGAQAGYKIAKLYDGVLLHAIVKGAEAAAPQFDGADLKDWNGGFSQDITAANLANPVTLERAIRDLVASIRDTDVDFNEPVAYLSHSLFNTLIESNLLTSVDYSPDNANVATMKLYKVGDIPIQPVSSSIMPTVNAAHILGAGYNVSAREADARVIIGTRNSVKVATAPVAETTIWYSEERRGSYVDVARAFAAMYQRADACATLFEVP